MSNSRRWTKSQWFSFSTVQRKRQGKRKGNMWVIRSELYKITFVESMNFTVSTYIRIFTFNDTPSINSTSNLFTVNVYELIATNYCERNIFLITKNHWLTASPNKV